MYCKTAKFAFIFSQMINATIRKVAPQENEADDDDGQNTTHSGSDGGGPPAPGADAKILKKPGLGKSKQLTPFLLKIKCFPLPLEMDVLFNKSDFLRERIFDCLLLKQE